MLLWLIPELDKFPRVPRFTPAYATHRIARADCYPSLQAWMGHARHVGTMRLPRALFEATVQPLSLPLPSSLSTGERIAY